MKIFAQRLKDLRMEKGLSTRELGREIDVSNATISCWESDIYDTKGEYLARLAKFFGVSADYLLGLKDN